MNARSTEANRKPADISTSGHFPGPSWVRFAGVLHLDGTAFLRHGSARSNPDRVGKTARQQHLFSGSPLVGSMGEATCVQKLSPQPSGAKKKETHCQPSPKPAPPPTPDKPINQPIARNPSLHLGLCTCRPSWGPARESAPLASGPQKTSLI